ncbi:MULTISPECIES: O-antigen ligase family protein [unclassified Rudaea]|uniref:O-antigen ligase family protein n=1 Tax=unclassified Rudaea TaxID=2627037 RepID=UPI0020160048|nr:MULTISPECIES: O-antigen ligase family protein [unclassified Rudaea]
MSSAAPSNPLRDLWPALLVLGVLVLLPLGIGAATVPIALCAIAGLVLAWRERHGLRSDAGVRLAAALFACYWLAALISAFDSVAPGKSWGTVAGALRFLPFAVFACLAHGKAQAWPRMVQAIGAVVALWLLDAWIQALTGYGIAGASDPERLSGIFGAGNLKLGPALAVLSPFVLAAARERFGRIGLIVAFVFALVPILLAGERSGWLMYALVALAFVWREAGTPLRFVGWSSATAMVAAVPVLFALHASPAFDARVDRTLHALQGTEAAVDYASSGRSMHIWPTALRMVEAHPFNGVGVRAFRYAYAQYAGTNDQFANADPDEGALHAHQIVLEVLSETGAIGLLLWIAGFVFAWRAWRRADADARARAFAPALALVAMTFPFNTHLAFYSAWWGLVFWWLLALYCAALNAGGAQARPVG